MQDVVFVKISNSLQQLSDSGTDLKEHIQRMIFPHYITSEHFFLLLKCDTETKDIRLLRTRQEGHGSQLTSISITTDFFVILSRSSS